MSPADEAAAWRKWFEENGWKGWDLFIGPCAHGRDPFTRCSVCGELNPLAARDLAVAAREREACARAAGKHLRNVFDQPTMAAEVEAVIRARGGT